MEIKRTFVQRANFSTVPRGRLSTIFKSQSIKIRKEREKKDEREDKARQE